MKIFNQYTFTAMVLLSFIIGGMSSEIGEVKPEYMAEWDTVILGALLLFAFFFMGFMGGIESKK